MFVLLNRILSYELQPLYELFPGFFIHSLIDEYLNYLHIYVVIIYIYIFIYVVILIGKGQPIFQNSCAILHFPPAAYESFIGFTVLPTFGFVSLCHLKAIKNFYRHCFIGFSGGYVIFPSLRCG